MKHRLIFNSFGGSFNIYTIAITFTCKKHRHYIECVTEEEYIFWLSNIRKRKRGKTNMSCGEIRNVAPQDRFYKRIYNPSDWVNSVKVELSIEDLINQKMKNQNLKNKKCKQKKLKDREIKDMINFAMSKKGTVISGQIKTFKK
ncbi:unnamed protein product [Cunninghamella echinulata]